MRLASAVQVAFDLTLVTRLGVLALTIGGCGLSLAASGAETAAAPRAAAPPTKVLKRGDCVAIVGDSITEQRCYSRFIEDYLLACVPELELSTVQFGWGGETASHFTERMENDLIPFKPNVVTTCYGMNDGQYRAYEDAIGRDYAAAMRRIIERVKKAGAIIVVGSPGDVDLDTWRPAGFSPEGYNENLGQLTAIDQQLASEFGMPFANVHDPLLQAMLKAKAAYGKAYHVCGGDGVHPAANGHLVMAYAFLKALGVDGQIGTITVDLSGGKLAATATSGHKIVSTAGDKVEIESTRYPFCFYGDPNSPDGTRSILPYVPFNDELNRFVLVVRSLKSSAATVTWGSMSKGFTREQLTAGVNLAAEFLDNPFTAPFAALDAAVAQKQGSETNLIKEGITNFPTFARMLGEDTEGRAALAKVHERLVAAHAKWCAEVRAAVKPVKYTITIQPTE